METRFSANGVEDFEDSPEFLKGPDLSVKQNVGRPPAPKLNDRTDDITFMQIDVDYYTGMAPGKIIAKPDI